MKGTVHQAAAFVQPLPWQVTVTGFSDTS